ncbi:MAG: endonuclease NucS [Cyanobacteriota bacterium]|nr:endonuclease NucS [Cyanobacteriota bacterium]
MFSKALIKSGLGWEFVSEEILEDFLYEHLEILLDLKVLDRQYIVNSQRCDILAVDNQEKLVVLELKNVEDRGVVQQLTRYYDALLDEKPFSDKVDYRQPVRLVAITPNFHRDNFTDRKYHTLDFQFLEFSVIQDEDNFYFCLKDIDNGEISKAIIPYQELENDLDLPTPSTALLKVVNNLDVQQQEEIFRIRRKILGFDSRMQEFSSAGSIKYGIGSGKSCKSCAEFFLDKGELIIFLWIPYKGGESSRIGRARIWTDWQDKALIEGYVSSGVGIEINRHKKDIENLITILQGSLKLVTEIEEIKDRTEPKIRYFTKNKGAHGSWELKLPVKKSTAKRYLEAIRRIASSPEKKKPITYEDTKLISLSRELSKEKRGIGITREFYPYKPLDSLIELALEKWRSRL